VYKVSADTGDNQSHVLQPEQWGVFHLPAWRSLQFDRAVVAALPNLVITESPADVRHLDSLVPVHVIIRMRRETIRNGAEVGVRPVDYHIIACLVSTVGGMSPNVTLTCYDTRNHDPRVGECAPLTVQECIWICVVAMRAYSKERLFVMGSSAGRVCRTRARVQPRQRTDPCEAPSPVVQGSIVGCHPWGARGMGS